MPTPEDRLATPPTNVLIAKPEKKNINTRLKDIEATQQRVLTAMSFLEKMLVTIENILGKDDGK